jgi:hypothetical protein
MFKPMGQPTGQPMGQMYAPPSFGGMNISHMGMNMPPTLPGGFQPPMTQTGAMQQMSAPQFGGQITGGLAALYGGGQMQPPMGFGFQPYMGFGFQPPMGGQMQQMQNQMDTAPQAPAQPAAPTRMGMTPELLRNFVVPAIRNFDVRQFIDEQRDRRQATRMGQPDRPPGGPRSKQGSGQQMDTAPQMPPQMPPNPNATPVREEDRRMRVMRALQQFGNRGFPFG